MSSEDSPPMRLVPGLTREGADLTKVFITRRWRGGLDPDGLVMMENFITTHKIEVVWIDPLMSLLGPVFKANAHFSAAREPMDGLSMLLESKRTTAIAVRHFTVEGERELRKTKGKSASGGAGYGPVDLKAAARSIISLIPDEERPGLGKVVKMHHSKANNSIHSRPAEFVIRGDIDGARVSWTFIPSNERPKPLDEFLLDILSKGTVKRNYVLSLARGAGFKDELTKAEAVNQHVIEMQTADGVTWSLAPDPFDED